LTIGIIAASLLCFLLGAIWAREEFPPYHQLKSLPWATSVYKSILRSDAQELNAKLNLTTIAIESTYLPLLLKKHALDTIFLNQAGRGGGLCSAGKLIFGISWRGEMFALELENGAAKRIEIRPPNGDDMLLVKGPDQLQVHDLECRLDVKTGDVELFLSYDFIDGEEKTQRLSRVSISKTSRKFEVTRNWELLYVSDPWANKDLSGVAGRIKVLESGQLLLSVAIPPDDIGGKKVGKTVIIGLEPLTSSIFTSGHRNIQGIEETEDGTLYATEHGPLGGDELNLLVRRGDYGWPKHTFGAEMDRYDWYGSSNLGQHSYTEYRGPVFAWLPSIATSNLIEVRNFHEHWNGDLLIATLKSRSLFRLRLHNSAVVFVERIWIGERIRDIVILEQQKIAMLTDSGLVLSLEADKKKLALNQREIVDARSKYLQKCTSCHHFGETTEANSAPSLTGLLRRNIASDNFNGYSEALLLRRDQVWTKKLLKKFLKEPNSFAPGTAMPKIELDDHELDKAVIFLSKL
jgi:glucose/arabinose dehydrogenase